MSRSTQWPYFLAKGSVSWKEKAGLIPDFLAGCLLWLCGWGPPIWVGAGSRQGHLMLLSSLLPKGVSQTCGLEWLPGNTTE